MNRAGKKIVVERCYYCQEQLKPGDPCMQLREDDGTTWLVHKRCLTTDNFELLSPSEPKP